MSIKKLVLNTVFITLAGVIVLALTLYFSLAVFTPGTLGKFYDSLGSESLSLKYYEKQYDKTEEFVDLVRICDGVDEYEDKDSAVKYLKILVNHKDYSEYCRKFSVKGEVSTNEYYYGRFAVATCLTGGLDDAIAVAKNYVDAYGLTEYNPYTVLLADSEKLSISADGVERLNKILAD